MSEPFQLSPPSLGSGVGWQRPSLFGDQFQLRLDPEIEAQMSALRLRLELDRLRTAWLHPNWLQLHRLSVGTPDPAASPSLQLTPTLTPTPSGAPTWLRYQPPPASPPIVPRGAGPDEPRTGEVGDLLRAIWRIPAVEQAATRLTDQLTDDFWRRRSTGERVLIVTWGTIIAGGTLAGILGNRESRVWALDRINGQDLSIPGVDGLSFRLYAAEGAPTGAGATVELPRGFTISGDSSPRELPGGLTVQDHRFTIQLNLLEAIPGLRAHF